MSLSDLGPVIIALIAALSAIASNRSASKANHIITQTSGKLDAEKEAYERARRFDTATIERQDEEIKELIQVNKVLSSENQELRDHIRVLEARMTLLERLLPENWEKILNERLNE